MWGFPPGWVKEGHAGRGPFLVRNRLMKNPHWTSRPCIPRLFLCGNNGWYDISYGLKLIEQGGNRLHIVSLAVSELLREMIRPKARVR